MDATQQHSAAQPVYSFPEVIPLDNVHINSRSNFRMRAENRVVRVMSKHIVICCDGTGNEISENISNVLKFYRVLRKTGKTAQPQVVFYDPGVGTLAKPNPWTKFQQDTKANLGLVTGYGLDDNVLHAYEFLIDHYEEGDQIYLFGFSRGAHTVRVLAGLIHMTGLLAPYQKNLAGAALTAYKQAGVDYKKRTGKAIEKQTSEPINIQTGPRIDDEEEPAEPMFREDRARQFARIVSAREPTIKFIGVWDTVASVIVPRPDKLYTFALEKLPFIEINPSVAIFRQAIAIDERRRMFRLSRWDDPQNFMTNRYYRPPQGKEKWQDIKQVWFAGVHSDVGGSYPEDESGLSQFSLIWMIDEATKAGLAVNPDTVNHLAWGIPRKGSPFTYAKPDVMSAPHDSMTGGWRVLEWLPKAVKYRDWTKRNSLFGHYIPASEPRTIPENAFIHESVVQRMEQGMKKGWVKKGMQKNPKMEQVTVYRPINLPNKYQIVKFTPEPKGVTDWKNKFGGIKME
jgi:uncharacterized protein (DUF2235 family)